MGAAASESISYIAPSRGDPKVVVTIERRPSPLLFFLTLLSLPTWADLPSLEDRSKPGAGPRIVAYPPCLFLLA